MNFFPYALYVLLWSVTSIAPAGESLEDLDHAKTRYAKVTVEPVPGDDSLKQLAINGTVLPIPEGYSDVYVSIEKKWEIGSRDVLLISTATGGNACPSLYYFVVMEPEQAHVSETFGNCAESPEVTRIKDTILVKFPRVSRFAPAETAEYDDGKVYGMKFSNSDNKEHPGELTMEAVKF